MSVLQTPQCLELIEAREREPAAIANPEKIAAATSFPILLLGGDIGASWEQVFDNWESALAAPNIRGLVHGGAR